MSYVWFEDWRTRATLSCESNWLFFCICVSLVCQWGTLEKGFSVQMKLYQSEPKFYAQFNHAHCVSRYFRKILDAISTGPFYRKFVHLPKASDPVDPFIRNQPKFYPYFRDAIGAMDGTHITCCPSAAERQAARNRKGSTSQNCLACVSVASERLVFNTKSLRFVCVAQAFLYRCWLRFDFREISGPRWGFFRGSPWVESVTEHWKLKISHQW
jgi:hypothetical protein